MNYTSHNQVEDMHEQLEAHLRPPLTCECLAVADEDVTPMQGSGRDERLFASVNESANLGGDLL
ncbi:hypothetical protein Astex_3362 [Asticcacaulis excentricus CB 48]|uniref:Uncharacterized protein n=1 Tax=Asticcacaulis excentricus (strain ATCC 15261 / DSM 4724 / KCTC 12464 / NCIMB 9791 / VKM B-1370 / CB 48) TaxID=573065 RepID=E8RU24_ASTEC|nr:hypothetical protein Astex_3362 [Asticcacaulis excentricus CB 48]